MKNMCTGCTYTVSMLNQRRPFGSYGDFLSVMPLASTRGPVHPLKSVIYYKSAIFGSSRLLNGKTLLFCLFVASLQLNYRKSASGPPIASRGKVLRAHLSPMSGPFLYL